MKNTLRSTITIIALSACTLHAKSSEIQDEAALLCQEIIKHELIVVALKEKLAALEEKTVFEVSITAEGISILGKPISLKELEKALTELTDDTKILIRAEPSVSHQEVVSVMERCTRAGLKNVAFATTLVEPVAVEKDR